jgi:hypothetical protein
MSTRVRVVVASLLLLALGGSAATLVVGGQRGPDETARAHARAACDHFAGFEDIVARDGSAGDAMRALADALAEARRAEAIDPRWTPLQSGIRTVQLSLEQDDAGAANVGIRVVRSHCGSEA